MVFAVDASVSEEQVRGRWGWFVALGLLMLVAGVIALGSVVLATIASVLVVGTMMILSGVMEIIHGFQMRQTGRFVLWVLIGALYVVGGFAAVWNPLLASTVLTLFLGAFLIFAGALRVVLAMRMRSGSQWAWVAASGVITLLLGAIIVFGWPVSSLYALGIFLGVDLIVAGISWVTLGLTFRTSH